jgi:hypothetical protein
MNKKDKKLLRLEVLTAMTINMPVFRAMMEAMQTSETSVNSYQSTRRYNLEDSHLHKKSLSTFMKSLIQYYIR